MNFKTIAFLSLLLVSVSAQGPTFTAKVEPWFSAIDSDAAVGANCTCICATAKHDLYTWSLDQWSYNVNVTSCDECTSVCPQGCFPKCVHNIRLGPMELLLCVMIVFAFITCVGFVMVWLVRSLDRY